MRITSSSKFILGVLVSSFLHCQALSLSKESSPFVQIAAATIPGSDPERPQKVNQDAHFSNGRDVIGVMDGHGLKGHLVTRFLQSRFLERLSQHLPAQQEIDCQTIADGDDADYEKLFARQLAEIKNLGNLDDWPVFDKVAKGLSNAFLSVHLDARIDTTIPTGRSGTTAIVAYLSYREQQEIVNLYLAGVGDSSAIVLDDTGACHEASIKSTVDNEIERRRIERSKGSIVGNNVFLGPVGIAMTRALGDSVMLTAGVVPAPLIERIALTKEKKYCVCLGSDGVFDVLSKERVASIIYDSGLLTNQTVDLDSSDQRLERLAETICSEAKRAWLGDLPIEPSVDDITCALMLVY